MPRRLRGPLDPKAIPVTVEIEAAIDSQVLRRKIEGRSPLCGRIRDCHPRPKLYVQREHSAIVEAAVGFGSQQEMIHIEGSIQKLPRLGCRICVFSLVCETE